MRYEGRSLKGEIHFSIRSSYFRLLLVRQTHPGEAGVRISFLHVPIEAIFACVTALGYSPSEYLLCSPDNDLFIAQGRHLF